MFGPLARRVATFDMFLGCFESLHVLTLRQKKNLSVVGMGWGLAFVLILIQAWERWPFVYLACAAAVVPSSLRRPFFSLFMVLLVVLFWFRDTVQRILELVSSLQGGRQKKN